MKHDCKVQRWSGCRRGLTQYLDDVSEMSSFSHSPPCLVQSEWGDSSCLLASWEIKGASVAVALWMVGDMEEERQVGWAGCRRGGGFEFRVKSRGRSLMSFSQGSYMAWCTVFKEHPVCDYRMVWRGGRVEAGRQRVAAVVPQVLTRIGPGRWEKGRNQGEMLYPCQFWQSMFRVSFLVFIFPGTPEILPRDQFFNVNFVGFSYLRALYPILQNTG